MHTNNARPKSLTLAYIAVFAALNALADLIPFTPIIGAPGASFKLGWISSSLTGILLGARIGGVSCLVGGLISLLFSHTMIFGPFGPLRPVISAVLAGLLVSKHWRAPAAFLFLLISIWLALPVGRDASIILVFHITGLMIVLLFREKIGELVRSQNSKKRLWGLFFVSYCGNISRHLFGNILLATLQNLQFIYFISAAPITLVEQLTFAIGTMLAGASLNRLPLRATL